MSTTKAVHNLQALDTARCNGDWDQVPELCRKVQKHAPGRKCLVLAASTESKLLTLRPPPPNAASAAHVAYSASLTSYVDALYEEVNSYHSPLPISTAPPGGESSTIIESDLIQARVVIAGLLSLQRKWDEVLRVVPGENEIGENWTGGGPGKSDYMDVVRIKALVLRGLALGHVTSDQSLPLQIFRAATRLHASYPRERATRTLNVWGEKALSYYALAAYHVWRDGTRPTPIKAAAPVANTNGDGEGGHYRRDSRASSLCVGGDSVGVAIGKTVIDEATVASGFRRFNTFINAIPREGGQAAAAALAASLKISYPKREEKRREVYRCYFKFLSLILLPANHPNSPIETHLAAAAQAKPAPVSADAEGADGQKDVAITTPAPTTTRLGPPEKLRQELKAISQIFEKYLISSIRFPRAEEYHEVIGEWVDQTVENWRVSGGSAEDAAPVVEILYRASRKSFHSPRILRHLFYTLTAIGNFTDAVSALNTYIMLIQAGMDRIQKGHHEKDFDSPRTIFNTVVEGIRVLCKFVGKGQEAVDVANKMEKWIDQWKIRDKYILAEIHRGIGMANAAFARQTPEAEIRPEHQQKAAEAFRKGLGFDVIDIQGWYGLALVEAEMRQIDNAMESCRKGLGALKYNFLDNESPDDIEGNARDYKRFAVPLLHLLALLMTATEDFETAEKVCKNAFEIVGEGREAVADLGVGDKIAIFELRISQLAIIEAVEDTETAISMAEQLLELYSMLFDGTHLVQRLQFSASYSSLQTANTTDGTPQSLGGALIKRPKSGYKSLTGDSESPNPPNAPKIQVTDTAPTKTRLGRSGSISGSTVKKMRSLGSLRLREGLTSNEPPTPPLPHAVTEASSLNFDNTSTGDLHLFHSLKNKLHNHHHLKYAQSSATTSATSVPLEAVPDEEIEAPAVPRRESIPHNLPQHKLPHPLGIGKDIIPDDGLDRRSVRRPIQLPEPKLAVDEERKQVLGALRKAWICVSGLYRRAGFYQEALMATEEASSLIGNQEDGEADVLAERAMLALSQNRKGLAAELFEHAIVLDHNNPAAILGLTQLLLEVSSDQLDENQTRPETRDSSETNQPAVQLDDGESYLNKLACRNRALGLLEKLVVTPRGWDLPDAWFLLADALEKSGEVDRAKAALWKVVELEDGTGVRDWRCCGAGVV
ncbi:Similar to Putative cargo-transport protein ypp1; acc. no. O94441 [Pyronema omphalodes CBS 100304]|uniref:Similar to Putative cargo-transport protein ypp1 acc. no. O94441 n=1 Tax=Pyronema omphalodes (strain CBS 100304) TaxID=1076935 RepID=U4L7R5_PYROM|nr:Similar to Putative cargo-transport protein ypp1; acc. no. O94441 [Pyronema omphalodes CBS 100304]